jgi:hypothetical protein
MSKENILVWLGLFGTGWVKVEEVWSKMEITPECLTDWIRKDWVMGDYKLIRHEVILTPRAIRKLKGRNTH